MSMQHKTAIHTPFSRAKTALKQWLTDNTYLETLTNQELDLVRSAIPMQQYRESDERQKTIYTRCLNAIDIELKLRKYRIQEKSRVIRQYLISTQTYDKLTNAQLATITIFATLIAAFVAFLGSAGQLSAIITLKGQWYYWFLIVFIIAGFIGLSCVVNYKFTCSRKHYEKFIQQFNNFKEKERAEQQQSLIVM